MNVHTLPAAEITAELWQVWAGFQAANPVLASPYFRPEYPQALRDAGRPFEVAVIEEAGTVVGLLPFERRSFGMARPVGSPLTDYQGVIHTPEWQPDLPAIARKLRLRSLDFDHLLSSQAPGGHGWTHAESPALDLRQGHEAWKKERSQSGSELFRDMGRKLRKAEREVGPVTFTWHTRDLDVLERLIDWKSRQYRQTGLLDIFAFGWPKAVLHRLLEHDQPEFGVVLSTMHFGDQLAAAHLGLRCRETLHSWFPGYDVNLQKFSSGIIMQLQLAESANSHGISWIDLGKGPEEYKQRLRSTGIPLAEGSIIPSPVVRTLRDCWRQTRRLVEASGCRRFLETPIRIIRERRKALELK